MKVAVLGSYPPLRGISAYCYELVHAIAHHCEVVFISFKAMYPPFLYPGGNLRNDGSFPQARVKNLFVRRTVAWYNPLSWLAEGMKANAALLHVQWWSLPLAPVYFFICLMFCVKRKPIVFTVHNVLPHENSRLYYWASRLLFRFGEHFIVHSDMNRQQLVESHRIPPKRISKIAHGPLDFQVNHHVDRNRIRSQWGFGKQHKVVLFFGAIRPYKGIVTAIKAFSVVKRQLPTAKLLIAGKLWEDWAPYAALIQKHNMEDDVITCLKYIPSATVHRYFFAADLVILPYDRFDSQSGVGGTALSFRKPLIVSRVGGLPELVKDPKAIVPPGDFLALAESISHALENPARLQEMADDAESIANRLSWTGIAERTTRLYQQLIEQTGIHH